MNEKIQRLAEVTGRLSKHLLNESGQGCHTYYEMGGWIMDQVVDLIKDIKPKVWQHDWPKEPGYYWAYGQYKTLLEAGGYPRDIMLVKVRRTGNNAVVYVGDGQFLYPREMDLVWLPAELPRGPE